MSAVLRQTLANLRTGRLQAGLVVVIVTAAAALLTVALATTGATGGAYERLVERTSGADLWLELDGAVVDEQQTLSAVRELDGVTATTTPRATLRGADLRFEDGRATVHVREWVDDGEEVARLAIVEGRPPDQADDIAVDVNVATTHELAVGDTIEILTDTGWSPAAVTAFTATAETCPYPTCQPTVVHLGPGGLAAKGLTPDSALEGITLGLHIDPTTRAAAVQRAAEATLPTGAILMVNDRETIQELTEYLLQVQSVFLLAFGVAAGIAAGALMANAIGQAVRSQTRRIGLLKAVGFTRAQVAGTYLVEQLGLAVVGSLFGLGAGLLVARASLRQIAMQYGERSLQTPLWIVATVPLIVLTVTVVCTILPVRRAARVDTITAIRTGSATRPRRSAALLRGVPAPVATGLADLRARPARTVATTLTLAIAVLTLVFASGTTATLQWFSDDPDAGFRPAADLTVLRPPSLSDAQVRDAFATRPEITHVAGDTWVPFRLPGSDEQLQGRFVTGSADFDIAILDGRRFERPGEVVAGYALARDHDLVPGDVADLMVHGTTLTVDVVGIYRESSNLGQLLMGDIATVSGLEGGLQPLQYHLTLSGRADAHAVAEALRDATDDALSPAVVADEGMGVLDTLPTVVLGLSLALVVIATVGVLSTVWMGVQERRRDAGLLKAIGMTPRQGVVSVITGVVAMALVAYLIALPVGLLGTHGLLDLLSRQLGFGPLDAIQDASQLLLILPTILLVAVAAALAPARRSGRVPVTEALRHE